MNHAVGFDNAAYLEQQKKAILERMGRFTSKLYLEFGGKLFFDYHAARVLPGYDPNVKMKLLQELRSQADFLLCIYAGDIERKKMRADFGHTYDVDAMKLIDDLRRVGHPDPGRRHHPLRQPALRAGLQEQARAAGHPRLHPPLHQGLSDRRRRHRQRRGLRRQRLHRDRASAGHRHGAGAGQRQAGHLPVPALPRVPPGPDVGVRQVRDLPHLEPAPQAPGQRRLRGGHGRPLRLQPGRSVPSRGLRQDRRQLQPGRRGLPGPQADPREDHRRAVLLQVAHGHGLQRRRIRDHRRRGRARSGQAGAHPALFPLLLRVYAGIRREGDRPAGRAPDEGARGQARGPAGGGRGPTGGGGGRGDGEGEQGRLRRGGHGAQGRLHRHGQELAPHARRVGPRPQRRQKAGRDPGQDPAPLALDRRIGRASSRRASSGPRASASTCPRSSSA